MDARLFIGGIAVVSAFACLYFIALILGSSLRRKRLAFTAGEEGSIALGAISWCVRNGIEATMPLARLLLRMKLVDAFAYELMRVCEDKGMLATKESVLSTFVAALGILLVGVGLLTRSAIGAIAVVACIVAVVVVLSGGAQDRRRDAVREEIPNALESMSACFGSGFTLFQTFQQVAQEVPGKLGKLFARGAHVLEMGGSAEHALGELREGGCSAELAFVAVALDVQHQNGGSLKQVLDAASDSVKSELALRRSLKVQTAQAKLSARVVVVMPFLLMAAFSLASPDFLSPFFASPAGYGLLVVALGMQVAGIVLVRRALSVDGVS